MNKLCAPVFTQWQVATGHHDGPAEFATGSERVAHYKGPTGAQEGTLREVSGRWVDSTATDCGSTSALFFKDDSCS